MSAALLSIAVGWVIVSADRALKSDFLWLSVAIAAVAIAAVGLHVAPWLSQRLARASHASLQQHPSATEVARHVLARRLYYAGMLTMPLLSIRAAGVTVSDYLFLAALAAAAVDWVGDREHRLIGLPQLLSVGIAAFAVGSLLATIYHSSDPVSSLGVTARVVYLLVVWFLLGTVVLRTAAHVKTAVAFWVGGTAICGFYALAQKAGVTSGGTDGAGRVVGLAEHVNDLGGLSAVAIVPAIVLAFVTRNQLYSVCALGAVCGLMLSGSIGAAIAALVALTICGLSRRMKRVVATLAAVGVCLLVYLSATTALESTPVGRFKVATDPGASFNQGTFYTRVDTIQTAWVQIKRDPFIGAGLDFTSARIYSNRDGQPYAVHNLFVGRWYESGLLGLIGIALIVSSFLSTAWRAVVQARGDERLLALSLGAAVVGFVIVSMSEPILYTRYGLAPAALAIALAAVQFRRSAASVRAQGAKTRRELDTPPRLGPSSAAA